MTTLKNTLAVVDGVVVFLDGKGKSRPIEVLPEVRDALLAQNKIQKALETGIEVSAEVMEGTSLSNHIIDSVPEAFLGKHGVLKIDGSGKFFLMCTCCGSLTTIAQARFSIGKWNQVVCIGCQRRKKNVGKYFTSPEERFDREIKFEGECVNHEKCGHVVTGQQLQLSLKVTNGQYRMCPKCLATYARVKVVAEGI